MNFFIFADNILVGWSELPLGDPSMGVAEGPFYPNEAYKQIQPLILEHQLYDGTFGEIDQTLLLAVENKLSHIHFRVQTENGEELNPDVVAFTDYSETLNDDPYLVSLLGLPQEEYSRYFYNQFHQYWKDQ